LVAAKSAGARRRRAARSRSCKLSGRLSSAIIQTSSWQAAAGHSEWSGQAEQRAKEQQSAAPHPRLRRP
jgi:hypothetical protein